MAPQKAIYCAGAPFLQKVTLRSVRIVISSGSEKSLTIKIDGFVKSPISVLRCIPRNFPFCEVRCIPRDFARLDLELFTLPSQNRLFTRLSIFGESKNNLIWLAAISITHYLIPNTQ